MMDIVYLESGIAVLEEEGSNVLLKDCLKYKISREDRKKLFLELQLFAKRLQEGLSIEPLIEAGKVKPLTRQLKARSCNLWEVRNPGQGDRLLFVLEKPDSIIVAAVSKRRGILSQAVNRGVNRWLKFVKEKRKSV